MTAAACIRLTRGRQEMCVGRMDFMTANARQLFAFMNVRMPERNGPLIMAIQTDLILTPDISFRAKNNEIADAFATGRNCVLASCAMTILAAFFAFRSSGVFSDTMSAFSEALINVQMTIGAKLRAHERFLL